MKVLESSRPRLPLAARLKLHQGSAHKDKKQYDRRRDKKVSTLDRNI